MGTWGMRKMDTFVLRIGATSESFGSIPEPKCLLSYILEKQRFT